MKCRYAPCDYELTVGQFRVVEPAGIKNLIDAHEQGHKKEREIILKRFQETWKIGKLIDELTESLETIPKSHEAKNEKENCSVCGAVADVRRGEWMYYCLTHEPRATNPYNHCSPIPKSHEGKIAPNCDGKGTLSRRVARDNTTAELSKKTAKELRKEVKK